MAWGGVDEAGGCRRPPRWGGFDGPEGRSRKGRIGKDGGRGRESSEGRAGFIALCRLEQTGTAPNPIRGAKPETAVHRYAVNQFQVLIEAPNHRSLLSDSLS